MADSKCERGLRAMEASGAPATSEARPEEGDAEDAALDDRSAATHERGERLCAPPPPRMRGAIERGKRLIETLQGMVDLLEGGTADVEDEKTHGVIAESLDRMWMLYMRRPNLAQEAALRYLEAVELSLTSRPNMSLEQRVAYVRDVLGARFPEYLARVDANVVELTVRGFTGLDKKAPTLFDAVQHVVRRGVYKSSESPRIAYLNYLEDCGWRRPSMLTRDRVADDVERAHDEA
ncbi:hypothetical protein LVJ94_05110 [Pendulispora rubella]|uniref:Uncharacterized protein n=1 Tax=Pendulispora rubella TaxID=2741070 RepID=A0ABZ2L6Q1_9BACT